MKIPSAQQMKELDAQTIKEDAITSLELMERAAKRIIVFFLHTYTDHNRPIVIFAGPGNNGGDGLALARLLIANGYNAVRTYLFNTGGSLSADCQANKARLLENYPNADFAEITQTFEAPELLSNTLIVDALFGTGLNRPLSGGFASLVQFINNSKCEVVSIDMPSGLMSEDNTINSPSSIIQARYTLTLGLPKLALLLADCQTYCGEVFVLDIGLHEELLSSDADIYSITHFNDVQPMLRPRPAFGHKGTFGHGLLIAGKYGMAGAAILSAKACLRSGVGKVTIHTPQLNNNIFQTAIPEAILHHDDDKYVFSTPLRASYYSATAIGPGIGTDKKTALAFIEQVGHTATPLVVDADGINILGGHKGWIAQLPAQTILTPHPGEMQRLGICNPYSYSLLLEAVAMAKKHQFYIILKGHYSAVCSPTGHVYFNPTGNNGMATAGSGDVLTGILLALLAQQYPQEEACRLGVYLHGLAGDLAAEALGEYAVTASDIIEYLPQAFFEIQKKGSAQDKHCTNMPGIRKL